MADVAQRKGIMRRLLPPSLAGWNAGALGGDFAAGLTLAAIAIPEQMATAKLGGFSPELGLFVFIAGTAAFILLGANRYLSSGSDSTITPIFAGALGVLAAQGSPAYAELASVLAIAVGLLVMLGGIVRLGWIANFLSVPVTTGFLAGIAVHILASQLPAVLGVAAPQSETLARLWWLFMHLGRTNPYTLVLAAVVFALSVAGEQFQWRIPGALIGLAIATASVGILETGAYGIAVVGATSAPWPHFGLPALSVGTAGNIAALALVITMVIMVQTAATTRAFTSLTDPQDVNRDFIGVGAGNILAGLFGLFPLNASPPRTAAVEQAGGRSQLSGLFAAAFVIVLVAFGRSLLQHVPLAALAGVLLSIALRISRPSTFALVLKQTRAEFALILATLAAIVVLPIEAGVGVGISLSVLQGIWTITRTRLTEFERVPGTTVWWPPSPVIKGEKLAHIRVVAFEAPLSFLNADEFRRGMIDAIERDPPHLIVFEASGVAEIDFTAAETLLEIIERCRVARIRFAIARLTSSRAQEALTRFGIAEKLGPEGEYRTVDEAVRAFEGKIVS